jgi:sugar/nucleoside kinase (ribokinase family)
MNENFKEKHNMNAYEVFLVGRYFCDLVFANLPEIPRLGHEVYSQNFHLVPGGVFTPAIALHRLGVRTAWPCLFGNDPFSGFVKERALNEKVDTSLFEDSSDPSLHITAAFSFKKERGFLSYMDPVPEYDYKELIVAARPQWVYITHLVLGRELDRLVTAARSVGAKVYLDCQAHNLSLKEPSVRDGLRQVDIFSPNAEEACKLTGKAHLIDALEELSKHVKTVVIKDGSVGCHLKNSHQTIHEPGIKVDAVDTTGAGDNFDSGFLYGLLRGYPLQKTMRIANICGGLSTQGYGGTDSSPTEADLLRML